ncbi:MAG TPA: cyclodeaminase/cyclohydrolase family protein [Thermoplasmata archaeon]|nr:cyclodeaminase/cyclohydrolase family protein [Thermoplasmata archaeon]
MGVRDETVGRFLDAVAAPTPTPGGGSASAFAGALAAALSRMVAGLARDRKGYEDQQGVLRDLESRAVRIQARLVELVDEDAKAYEAVLAAMRLPRTTDAERAERVARMQAAYQRATEVPLETMRLGVEALELAEVAADKGNRSATTDAGVAVLLSEAAIRGASLNCRVNLASIRDERVREDVEKGMTDLLARAQAVGHRAMALVEGRL